MVVVFADFGKVTYLYTSKSLIQTTFRWRIVWQKMFFRRNNVEVAVDLFGSY